MPSHSTRGNWLFLCSVIKPSLPSCNTQILERTSPNRQPCSGGIAISARYDTESITHGRTTRSYTSPRLWPRRRVRRCSGAAPPPCGSRPSPAPSATARSPRPSPPPAAPAPAGRRTPCPPPARQHGGGIMETLTRSRFTNDAMTKLEHRAASYSTILMAATAMPRPHWSCARA